ncbi:MAG: hypothetical protein OEQ47_00400 [Acidimicrobiia bacterium]|nr:hypothetical protein [Acidimicrobiia bacterium]
MSANRIGATCLRSMNLITSGTTTEGASWAAAARPATAPPPASNATRITAKYAAYSTTDTSA